MRPRTFPTAQLELEHINVALHRAYDPPKRRLKLRCFGFWPMALALVLFPLILVRPSAGPLDAKLAEIESDTRHPGSLWKDMWLPDGRRRDMVYRGDVKRSEDLPKTGNKLYDIWSCSGDDSYWVWIPAIGSNVPTWIDP